MTRLLALAILLVAGVAAAAAWRALFRHSTPSRMIEDDVDWLGEFHEREFRAAELRRWSNVPEHMR